MKKILSLLMVLLFVSVCSAIPAGYENSIRMNMTINHSYFSENQLNFPYAINLTNANHIFDFIQTGGKDFCLFDSSDNPIYFEIEHWDDTLGSENAFLFANLSISATTDTVISAYFNVSTPCPYQGSGGNVWNKDFKLVHHFNETSGHHIDSSPTGINSVAEAVTNQGAATGISGKADTYNGGGTQTVQYTDLDYFNGDQITMEFWVYQTAETTHNVEYIGKKYEYDSGIYNGHIAFAYYPGPPGDTYVTTSSVVDNNTYTYVATTFTYGAGNAKIYKNGVLQAGGWTAGTGIDAPPNNANTFNVSPTTSAFGNPPVGTIDEVRLFNTTRNASWINATYQTLVHKTYIAASLEALGNMSVMTVSTTCGSTDTIYNFTLYDEENFSSVKALFDGTFTLYLNGTYSYNTSLSNYGNYTNVCIFILVPVGSVVTMDSFQTYGSPPNESTYQSRHYFLLKAAVIPATTTVIPLYLENNSYAQFVQTTYRDPTGSPVSDAYIVFARYYPSIGEYKTVAMALTNTYGSASTPLFPNTPFYRITTYLSDGTILETFGLQQIACAGTGTCNFVLQSVGQSYGFYWQYTGSLAHYCLWNATGGFVVCYFTDTSGLVSNFSLSLSRFTLGNSTLDCVNSTVSSSGVLTCTPSNATNGDYSWNFRGHINPLIEIESGVFNLGANFQFGMAGLIFSLVIICVFAFAGLTTNSPVVVLILTEFGILVSVAAGFLSIAIGGISSILFIGVVMLYQMKRD